MAAFSIAQPLVIGISQGAAIGLVAIAVPIHRGRSVVGALSIAARSTGFDEQTYLPALRKAAERIELEMNRMD